MDAASQPRIQLELGDLLSTEVGLLVLPFAPDGTLDEDWASALGRAGLDVLATRPGPGEVAALKLPATDRFVGFVALEATPETLPARVADTAAAIGSATGYTTSRTAACPLLGSGPGMLSPLDAWDAMSQGFVRNAAEGDVLRVIVGDPETYELLDAEMPRTLTDHAAALLARAREVADAHGLQEPGGQAFLEAALYAVSADPADDPIAATILDRLPGLSDWLTPRPDESEVAATAESSAALSLESESPSPRERSSDVRRPR
ncbi:MAG: hypothetical protein AAGC49_15765 [Brevundimonas sp.]